MGSLVRPRPESKIELTWWLFTGCALAVLLIVWAVSSALVLKAARMNPTENLRTE